MYMEVYLTREPVNPLFSPPAGLPPDDARQEALDRVDGLLRLLAQDKVRKGKERDGKMMVRKRKHQASGKLSVRLRTAGRHALASKNGVRFLCLRPSSPSIALASRPMRRLVHGKNAGRAPILDSRGDGLACGGRPNN